MEKRNKKVTLGLATFAGVAFGVFGLLSLNAPAKTVAKADNTTMIVDTLGNLEWEMVEEATAYSLEYTIDGENFGPFTVENNTVNASLALMKAINVAKENSLNEASVTFKVTPIGAGNEMIYTHSIDSYINFGYSTHDISSVNSAYGTQEIQVENTFVAPAVDNRWIPSAIYKNDLLTMGFQTDVSLSKDYGVSFFLFNGKKSVGDEQLAKNANYRIRLFSNGNMAINNKGDSFAASSDFTSSSETALVLGEKYYLSMGVFDTFNIAGDLIGETVYFQRSVYDADLDCLRAVGKIEYTYTTAEVENAEIAYETATSYTGKDNEDNEIKVEKSAFVIKAQGSLDKDGNGEKESINNYVYIFSGLPDYDKLDAPTAVYYDNVDATLRWNKVDNASGYEWRVGNNSWQNVFANKVKIDSLFTEYNEYGFLPLYVRAVNGSEVGAESRYNIDLKAFYKARSAGKDLTELYPFTTSTKNSYCVDKNNGATNGGYFYETPQLTLNTHVSLAFTANDKTPEKERFILLRLFRNDESESIYASKYDLALWGDGTVYLTPSWSKTTGASVATDSERLISNFRVAKVVDEFEAGVKYYLTFGVDEIYNGNDKIANRITVRIAEETDGGLSQKTVGVLSYDYKYYDKWTEGTWIQLGAHSNVVSLWQAKNEQIKTRIVFAANDELVATKYLSYGDDYDFSNLKTLVNVDGYNINGWTYTNDTEILDFPECGVWNRHTAENGFLVEAKLVPIKYDITYTVSQGAWTQNPTQYTVESDWTLNAPVAIPEGKVFDGWYEISDTDFSTPITTLKGKTGDIELVARFVDGYSIKVDGLEHLWKLGDGAFTLLPSQQAGKTFVKWRVLNGNTFVDYTGEDSFIPTKNTTFKGVYEWTNYAISYVVDNGVHENVNTYTAETPVAFANATKQGYFFVGWYTDSAFTNRIVNTNGLFENITVYAKFVKDELPTSIALETSKKAQKLPVLDLPEGSRYTVKLCKGASEISNSDEYLFSEAGEYALVYSIVLPTGETLEKTVALTVKQVYEVILYYGDGETLVLKKYAGEKLSETEIPSAPENCEFGGLYTDEKYTKAFNLDAEITSDIEIHVKWTAIESENKSSLGWIIGGIVGGVVVIGAGIAIFFIIKKKKRK